MAKANECMREALKTYEDRAAQYGDSYLRHGEVMKALLPNPPVLQTVEDFNRFGVLNMMVSKMVRYCQNFQKGHIDSTHDLGVYSFIMEELDRKEEKANEPKYVADINYNTKVKYETPKPLGVIV